MEVKPAYKQTEVGVIPEDWEVKPLGSIASIATGNTPPTRDTANYGDEFLFVSPVDLGFSKYISRTEKMLSKKGFSISRPFPKGSVLFVCIGSTIGKCGIASEILTSNQQINAILPSGVLSSDYLYYAVSAVASKVKSLAGEQAVPIVNKTQFSETAIPVPATKAEQEAIAEALSDVDALIGALNQLIAKKRDLKQAAMQQLLTGQKRLPGFHGEWKETTLGEIGECIIGLTYKPENVVDHGLLVLRASNIQNGQLTYDDNVYVNIEVSAPLITRPGDILICVRNGSRALIGKCAMIDEATSRLTFGAFMSVYRTNHSRFIFHAFQAQDIQRQIHENIGATINQITNKDLKSFRVKLPPEAEQTAIAEVLSDMDAELAALEQRRDKTRALKQGMMQELLTGRIRLL
jgi:type I restriction enzyme S subunit